MAAPNRNKIFLLTLLAFSFIAWPLVLAAAGSEGAKSPEIRLNNSNGESIPPFTPNTNLEFSISKTGEIIQIDGRLNEPFWKRAAKLTNFCEIDPGDNAQPKVRTEAFFAYDADFFYMGFICHDQNPGQIRASVCDRDEIFSDDCVGIIVDTFNDQQTGYEFFVNPHGIQGDLRRTHNNEDSSFDTIWESAGEINSVGWTAEVAIPFRSIRFPDSHEQEWRIHIIRIRPRDSREQISWAPLDRDESCLFCQAGIMRGIEGVNKGRNIEILPYVIGSQYGGLDDADDPGSNFTNDDINGDAGFGVKYGLTPNLTLDFTYNPDFSQIESDAAQIDVNTTFALFFPERRPFFLEGSDIFSTYVNAVYTRSVNDPVAAAKLTGKVGKYAIGYIFARDDASPFMVPFDDWTEISLGGKSFSNILRVKRDILSDSHIGLLFTDRRFSKASNSVFGFDSRVRFKENYILSGQVLGSYTKEPNNLELSSGFNFPDTTFNEGKYTSAFDGEDFTGLGFTVNFNRNARHWNFNVWYNDANPAFRTDNGFVTNNNYRSLGFWNGVLFQPNNRLFDMIQPQLNWGLEHNHEGVFKDTWIQPSIYLRFKKQTSLSMGYIWSNERFKDVLVEGIRRFWGNIDTDCSEILSGGAYTQFGRSVARGVDTPFLGHERYVEVWATLKPTSQLRINFSYMFARMLETASGPDLYSGYITRTRLTYQFTRHLFLRLVTQYNDFAKAFEIDPLLSYKINPFTVFFIGSTHDMLDYGGPTGYKQTDRQFFVKFQYLIRV